MQFHISIETEGTGQELVSNTADFPDMWAARKEGAHAARVMSLEMSIPLEALNVLIRREGSTVTNVFAADKLSPETGELAP